MAEDTDVLVQIDAPEDAVVVTQETPPKDKIIDPPRRAAPDDDGTDALRAQLKAQEDARAAESQRATRAEAEVIRQREAVERAQADLVKERGRAADSESSAMESAIAAAQSEADAAARDYQSAFEAGDSGRATEAQRKMARAEARVIHFQGAKADLEVRKAETPERPQEQPRQERPAPVDQLETAIANMSPRSGAWLRKHREFFDDEVKNAEANLAHKKALKEGFIPDSDAYFDRCEQLLGLKEDELDESPQQQQPRKPTRKPAMPAAPVSRDASPSNGNLGHGQVVLTPGEQRAAQDGTVVWNADDPSGKFKKGDPVGLKEYARRKAAMQGEGRYAGNYTEQ